MMSDRINTILNKIVFYNLPPLETPVISSEKTITTLKRFTGFCAQIKLVFSVVSLLPSTIESTKPLSSTRS